jgi:hypothetical protein
MQKTNISQSDEPLSKHNFAFQHRLWIIEHCVLAIMAALMVAALLGTLNLGPFSKSSINTNAELAFNANGLVRRDATTNLYYYYLILSPEPDTHKTHR